MCVFFHLGRMALGLLFLEWETSCPFQARKAVEQAMQGHLLGGSPAVWPWLVNRAWFDTVEY